MGKVQKIELSQSEAVVEVGKTLELTARALPEDAADKGIVWSSSNTDVATVENGVVTGCGTGNAVITALATDGSGVEATCSVEVTESEYVIENGVLLRYTGIDKVLMIPETDNFGNPVTAIGESAFAGNTEITSVTLPASIAQIGAYAFDGCTALESVNVSNSMTAIGKAAFRGCKKLTFMTKV